MTHAATREPREKTTLGAIAIAPYGLVDGPFGSNLPASSYQESGIPVIRGSNLSMGTNRFDDSEFVFVSEDTAQRLQRSLCHPGDIVFTKKGTIGQTGLVPEQGPYDRYLLSSNQMKLTVDPAKADPLFIYYLVSSPEHRRRIIQDASVTGVPKTNVEYLRNFAIELPPLAAQRLAAICLDALDDKIELNRRMSQTLEEIARALFKSWFVDFDPVHAKAAGREPVGMDAETAALFPSEFEESELGLIPRGWRVAHLGDIIALGYGRALKDSDRDAGSIPVYGSNGIVGFHSSALVDGPGVVIGRKGNPGTVKWSNTSFFPIDTTFYVIPLSDELPLRFIYHLLQEQNLPFLASDSVVPGLNRNVALLNISVLPIPELAEAFGNVAMTLADAIASRQSQSDTLQNLRDVLLPELISGKLVTFSHG